MKACIENLYEALKNKKFEEITDLVAIPTAKVPIIKFKHTQSQLVGDFSMYNTLGQENTKLLKTYADIDKRVVVRKNLKSKYYIYSLSNLTWSYIKQHLNKKHGYYEFNKIL